jgi:hypothetical protein
VRLLGFAIFGFKKILSGGFGDWTIWCLWFWLSFRNCFWLDKGKLSFGPGEFDGLVQEGASGAVGLIPDRGERSLPILTVAEVVASLGAAFRDAIDNTVEWLEFVVGRVNGRDVDPTASGRADLR